MDAPGTDGEGPADASASFPLSGEGPATCFSKQREASGLWTCFTSTQRSWSAQLCLPWLPSPPSFAPSEGSSLHLYSGSHSPCLHQG